MSGEPALDKVLTALRTTLGAALTGVMVDTDRPVDDDYGNAEIAAGAVNIVSTGTTFTQHYQNETLHTASVDLDLIVSVQASPGNAPRLRSLEADVVACLWANRTLGGLVLDIRWTQATGAQDIQADQAGRTLSIEILFLTPLGDHRTVIGASGPIP